MKTTMFPSKKALRSGLVAVATFAAVLTAVPTRADTNLQTDSIRVANGEVRNLQLGVGRSMIVDLGADAQEIFVGDPKIANAIVRSARRLYLTTLQAGQTTIFALGPDGRKIAVLDVTVGRDVEELAKLLKSAIADNDIHIRTVGGTIILTGSVASAGDAQQALDIAQGFVDQGGLSITASSGGGATGSATGAGKVINSLMIRGLDQVSMRVTISEIRRDVEKQLGVSYSGTGTTGLTTATVGNPFGVNGTLQNTAQFGWSMAGEKLSATLAAFEQEGVVRTLAEPTVTAISGERAKFLAGGTVPILAGGAITNGVFTPSIAQQPYGVTLNFTPVVLSQGRIQLRVATEVTDVDPSKTITIFGAPVPGFRTRRNETTVELPSGGSIVTAGLLSTQSQQAITGVPGLMNLPVLGSLFRSRDYQRAETELLIVVTPYIVHAIDPKDVTRPDQNFQEASDPQGWLLGRVNRIYSSSGGLRPMPNYTGHVGFITD